MGFLHHQRHSHPFFIISHYVRLTFFERGVVATAVGSYMTSAREADRLSVGFGGARSAGVEGEDA